MKRSLANDAPSAGRVYLLRHGSVQTAGGGKRYTGAQDLALSAGGLDQARAWADYFAGAALAGIISSDLKRCLETARLIGAQCNLIAKEKADLREVCLGAWEGQRFDTVAQLDPLGFRQRGHQIADHRPPGGESFRDLLERVWPIFEAAARGPTGPILIVTHAGVIRVLLCRLLGMPLENLFSIGQRYGGLSIVDARSKGYRIQAVNIASPAGMRPG